MLVVKQHNVNYILCYNVKLIPMLVLIYIRTYVVLMLVFKQHDVNYIIVISMLGCKYVKLIHI